MVEVKAPSFFERPRERMHDLAAFAVAHRARAAAGRDDLEERRLGHLGARSRGVSRPGRRSECSCRSIASSFCLANAA